jgi:hypothetical protein
MLVELVVTVGRVVEASSDWLVGGAEDGEILDCCMICAIVGGAERMSERLAGSVVLVDQ